MPVHCYTAKLRTTHSFAEMAAISVPEERHPLDDSELGCPLPFDLGHFPGRDRLCSDFYGAVMLASGHRFLIGSAEAADTLAAFLAALHQPAPDDAPAGRNNRGGPLADSGEGFAHFLKETTDCGLISEPDAVREVWDDALAAPEWTGPSLWLHGALRPPYLTARARNFCGVVDFGDMCAGDPACALAAFWQLLPHGCIDRFLQSSSSAADAATLRRARGWAVSKALACILIGDAGGHGRPGGRVKCGPPADSAAGSPHH